MLGSSTVLIYGVVAMVAMGMNVGCGPYYSGRLIIYSTTSLNRLLLTSVIERKRVSI